MFEMEPNVKKLIVGFLILAAGASSSALILSAKPAASSQQPAASATQTTTLSGNAFVDNSGYQNTDGSVADQALSTTTEAMASDPMNLTNALADSFLNDLVASNPDGTQTDANGNSTVTPPDDQAILQEFSSNPALANLQIPNWDIEAAEQKINIQSDYTKADIDNYASSVGNVIDKYLQSTNLQSILQSDDPTEAEFAESNLESALQNIAALQTPAPLAAFQKSLVKLLVYEKNYAALAVNVSDDPVKTSLIANAEQTKFNAAAQEFSEQWQKITGQPLSVNNGASEIGSMTSFLGKLFGIQTANAQFVPVFDAAATAGIHANTTMSLKDYLQAYLQNVILQIEKNLLMMLVQQKVLTWIQGSGAPRFIQNWGSTLVNSYAAAATNALNQQFSCVPSFMLPSLKILLSTPQVGTANSCAAQWQSQLGNNLQNLQNFYNNFANGGFNSYFSLFQPGGNAFGALITISDNAVAAGSNAQQATQAKVTSAQGYNGSETCGDNSLVYVQGKYLPDGSHYVCQDNSNGSTYYATVGAGGSVTCGSGQSLTTAANGNLCANGSTPQVTTPGNVTNQAMGTAMNSTPTLIAGSYEITGLAAAFIQSLLNTLAQSAINYTTKAAQGVLQPSDSGLTGIPADFGSSTVIQSANELSTNSTLANQGVSCNADNPNPVLDASTPQATVNFQAVGGALDADGYPPTYTWSSSDSGSGIGGTFSETYAAANTYTVTVTASTDNSSSTCTVVVTNSPTSSGTVCGGTTSGSCSDPTTQACEQATNGTWSCQPN